MTLTTLRDRLRHETAPDHAAAACALEATGCLNRPDPRAFLAIQAASLLAHRPDAAADDPETGMAQTLQRRIRAALRQDLGMLPTPARPDRAAPVMPTGFVYVVLGATVGISLIAPRWQGTTRFLDCMTRLGGEWRALSVRLDGRPAAGPAADRAVAAARAVFAAVIAASSTRLGAQTEAGSRTGVGPQRGAGTGGTRADA